ncbi:hypothetical protein K3G63_16280 [Hymenobacter sp. HSC-4F20]|uniref:hypothetical protein n=1 Tax=Hymenobacter sp. HSC-4F20 TaxID=2864135 RepID=UPI001C729E51|nr:hypothetical protein [Hymenobacter sp. HSC-4F20]MBX0292010.1 hypothetical protein [Hymenobacter sp. HSC-4F20]
MPISDPVPGFNPDAGALIAPALAEQWTANYRQQPLTDAGPGAAKRINAYYLSNQILTEIQAQQGCVGLRFYMGLDKPKAGENKAAEYQMLVVGVDANGYDMVPRPATSGELLYEDGIVGDNAQKCPSVCDSTSPLTS